MVLKPPPPPPPEGPQLPGGSLSSDPLGRNEQEAEVAWRARALAFSSCSWRERDTGLNPCFSKLNYCQIRVSKIKENVSYDFEKHFLQFKMNDSKHVIWNNHQVIKFSFHQYIRVYLILITSKKA